MYVSYRTKAKHNYATEENIRAALLLTILPSMLLSIKDVYFKPTFSLIISNFLK